MRHSSTVGIIYNICIHTSIYVHIYFTYVTFNNNMYYQVALYTKLQTGTLELLQMHKKSKVNLAVNKKKNL